MKNRRSIYILNKSKDVSISIEENSSIFTIKPKVSIRSNRLSYSSSSISNKMLKSYFSQRP